MATKKTDGAKEAPRYGNKNAKPMSDKEWDAHIKKMLKEGKIKESDLIKRN